MIKPKMRKDQGMEEGNTGIPLVDACMRCLVEQVTSISGCGPWSFLLTHHLFQDWREVLTGQDVSGFRPISPVFDQAGVTGINTVGYTIPQAITVMIRKGFFIQKVGSELTTLQFTSCMNHGKSTVLNQRFMVFIWVGLSMPIVDVEATGKFARDQIWKAQKTEAVKTEAEEF